MYLIVCELQIPLEALLSVGSLQKYGVAEGRPLSELRAMAKAAGEECPAFTPPGGETLDQVCSLGESGCVHELVDVRVAET